MGDDVGPEGGVVGFVVMEEEQRWYLTEEEFVAIRDALADAWSVLKAAHKDRPGKPAGKYRPGSGSRGGGGGGDGGGDGVGGDQRPT